MSRTPCSLSVRLYRAVSPVLCGAAPMAAPWSPKLAEGLRGREGLTGRLLAAAPRLQGCVWFHASSVGEFEQARPLIEGLRAAHPDLPLAATHFSPSGMRFAERRPAADFHDYLPLDDPAQMQRLVAAWNPRALIVISADLWPNLVMAAGEAGVPVALLAAGLPPESGRLRGPARGFYRDLLGRLECVGACTEADRERFLRILPRPERVLVTGNTRTEQVIRRWEQSEAGPTAAALASPGGRRLVLGSTWPPDEQLWLPILPELLARFDDLQIVLTPHEPHPERLADLERQLASLALPTERLSAVVEGAGPGSRVRVVLVDSVGVLAEIYRAGDLAYVGGAFTTGVHNTMEPAVAGLPVCFGPRIGNAEEAGELVRRGAGWILREPAEALERASRLLGDAVEMSRASLAARQVVLDQRGATERSLQVIEGMLAGGQR